MNLETKIFIAWIFLIVVFYISSHLEYYFFGKSYNKPFYMKHENITHALFLLIIIAGVVYYAFKYAIQLFEWWFLK